MKIVCYGDSNTYGYDPRSYFGGRYAPESRWVDILEATLGCEMVNAGENGREIPWREAELRQFQQLVENAQSMDLVIIMLGTNDLLQGNSVEVVVKRMEAFLRQIDREAFDVLLIAPPLMQPGEWVFSRDLLDASKSLNVAYRELARNLGVRFADAGEWMLPLAFDGVHLTQEGHSAFAEALFQYLDKENEICCRLV